ncbi:hypothetical protein AB0B63_07300 [Micromonospora sp. NPDC049081]|uniref:hypothetical protein n=1 Tax=Micromonospora sp. NPDC049081 TaxID=3155150 RepID=UPI0033E8493F
MTDPQPTATGSMHRLDGDLWIGVVNDCTHTIGPDTMDRMQDELEDHMRTCPDMEANQ